MIAGASRFSALSRLGLAPTLAAIVLVTAGSVALVLDGLAERRLESELTREFESKGEAIALSLAYSLAPNTRETLATSLPGIQATLDAGRTIEGVRYVYIQDWEGSILVHTFIPTFPPRFVETNWIEPGGLPRGVRVQVARDLDIDTVDGRIQAIDVAAPISGGELGVVHVGMDRAFIKTQVTALRRSMTWIALLIAMLGVGLGLAFALFAVVRPIRAVRGAAIDIIRTGDLTHELRLTSGGEIGDLVASFNRMILDLRRSRADLDESNRTLARRVEDRTREAEERALELERANDVLAAKQQELDQKNRELVRASQAKSQFLASMSHELRTPMNSIIGFTDLLLAKSTTITPKERANLERVLGNARHLLSLINNVLDLSKVEAGKMELAADLVDLRSICDQTATMAEALVIGKPVALVRELREVPHVKGDSTRLRQVVLNLLSNACKFTDEGRVVVACERDGDRVVVRVTDTGMGMTAEDAGTLFEEFRQVGRHRGREGTGLGLALSRHMVQLMGGTIHVESRLGEGSTFTVRLPVATNASIPVLLEAVIAHATTPLLVVTDDPMSAVAIRESLTGRPYSAHVAFSVEDALPLARSVHPAAVLIRMTSESDFSWRVLRALKADPMLATIPAVVFSVVDGRPPLALCASATEYVENSEPVALVTVLRRFGGREVLIVDDDPAVHEILGDALKNAGFVVRNARGGAAAIRECGARPPDLVLLDLMMPEVDGFDVLQSIRSHPATAQLPVIVLTNKDLSSLEQRELSSRVERVFEKASVTGGILVQALEKVLDDLRSNGSEAANSS